MRQCVDAARHYKVNPRISRPTDGRPAGTQGTGSCGVTGCWWRRVGGEAPQQVWSLKLDGTWQNSEVRGKKGEKKWEKGKQSKNVSCCDVIREAKAEL